MKRIAITAATGSGKTTLARRVAAACGHEMIDIDELYWLPGWTERDGGEFETLVAQAVARDNWVLSGNYSKVRPLVWARADLVVWLDYPFPTVFWRLLKRSIARAWGKTPICNGNTESFARLFSKDGIIAWLFKTYRRRKQDMTAAFDNPQAYPHITFVRLRNQEETEAWFRQISSHR